MVFGWGHGYVLGHGTSALNELMNAWAMVVFIFR